MSSQDKETSFRVVLINSDDKVLLLENKVKGHSVFSLIHGTHTKDLKTATAVQIVVEKTVNIMIDEPYRIGNCGTDVQYHYVFCDVKDTNHNLFERSYFIWVSVEEAVGYLAANELSVDNLDSMLTVMEVHAIIYRRKLSRMHRVVEKYQNRYANTL